MTTPPRPELSEKDFINESYSKDPFPLWLWLFLVTALTAVLWGGYNWYGGKLNALFLESPFLKVTNRELSLFLWQNPEYMRINAKDKTGYLPSFLYTDKVTIDLPHVEDYAVAPPELLFRYHTWHRLISSEFTERAIPLKEFRNFISYVEEWQPAYWKEAPKEYVDLIKNLASSQVEDLSSLSKDAMPMQVRMAFQGWKNYYIEGKDIDNVNPSVGEVRQFLSGHPHYARNFWLNIVQANTPQYLISLMENSDNSDETKLPKEEFSPFLRVAIYNYLKAQKSSSKES